MCSPQEDSRPAEVWVRYPGGSPWRTPSKRWLPHACVRDSELEHGLQVLQHVSNARGIIFLASVAYDGCCAVCPWHAEPGFGRDPQHRP